MIKNKLTAEQSLDHYRERLDQAQKAANMGVFDWDIIEDTVWWSDQEEALFGVAPGKFKGNIRDWINSTYRLDRRRVRQEIKKCIDNLADLDIEFRVNYPGNVLHWIRARAHTYVRRGVAYRMVGTHYDITARKHDEGLLQFKAEASRVLSSSLDYKSTLSQVATLAVEHIADWCTVDMVDDETREVILVAAAHKDLAKAKWARRLRTRYPVDMSLDTGLPNVLKTGMPLFAPFVSQEELMKSAQNRRQRELLIKIGGVNSVMIVPITLGERTIGAITFVSSESKRQYTAQDLELAMQLASRASLAIENAQLYEAVKQERERLDDLLDNVPGVVWEAWGNPVTSEQKITYVSSFAERMLGYPRKDWYTKPNFWRTIMHPDDREQASIVAQDNFLNKDRGISRFRWMSAKGLPIWVESQSFIVKDKKGKPIGMRGVVLDISEGMEQVRRKDEFISLASHELKTPITTIKAYTQILSALDTGPLVHEYLGKMESQISKLTRLVSELLDVSKITGGKLELHKEVVSLDKLLQPIVTDLQTIIETHRIDTQFNCDCEVNIDADRFAQVITNLVTNAVRYSPGATRVVIKSVAKSHKVEISIQDFGIGIAKNDQKNIFQRFYRVSNGIRSPGLGIGLFISREIITRHGGDIEIKSKPRQGSTFIISLPLYEKKERKRLGKGTKNNKK